jgi:S1-C subfamily serine protease
MKSWRLLTLTAVLVTAAVPLRAQERTREREREEARAKAVEKAAARAQARARAEARRRGWRGISFSTRDGSRWAVIDDVFPGSPAAKAGLQEGDTLVTWNGSSDVASSVGRRPLQPGEAVKLRVRRGGRDRDVTVVAGERPERVRIVTRDGDGDDIVIHLPDEGQWRVFADSLALRADSLQRQLRVMLRDSLGPHLRELHDRDLADLRIAARELSRELGPGGMVFGLNRGVAGAELAEINPGLSDYFGTDRGVVVLKVADEGPAERAGLRPGDVVVRAGDQPVATVSDLRRQILRAQDRERRSVELEVLRKGKHRTLSLEW